MENTPMETMNYHTISGDIRIKPAQSELGKRAWPEFMQHDSIVKKHWSSLYSDFLDFQFAANSGNEILGVGNAVPLHWEGEFSNLPSGGLDWAMARAVDDYRNGLTPNLLVGVQILLQADQINKGLIYDILDFMKRIALCDGIYHVALPVRPTHKHLYHLIPK